MRLVSSPMSYLNLALLLCGLDAFTPDARYFANLATLKAGRIPSIPLRVTNCPLHHSARRVHHWPPRATLPCLQPASSRMNRGMLFRSTEPLLNIMKMRKTE